MARLVAFIQNHVLSICGRVGEPRLVGATTDVLRRRVNLLGGRWCGVVL